MLGDAKKRLAVKQELLVGANETIGSLAGVIDRFQEEKACQYMMKAHSKDFAGKKNTGDHDLAKKYKLLTKKYKVLEKELAVSNKKVEDLTRGLKAVDTVFDVMKDGKADLGKICAALNIKLGKAISKNQELENKHKICA